MNPAIITAVVGLIGACLGTCLTYIIGVKDLKIKAQAEERARFESLMNEQQRMYDNLQDEVNRLQSRVDYLERENHQLKSILSNHGFQVINTDPGIKIENKED